MCDLNKVSIPIKGVSLIGETKTIGRRNSIENLPVMSISSSIKSVSVEWPVSNQIIGILLGSLNI